MLYGDDFNKLSLMEKRTLVFGEGKLIRTKLHGDYQTSLFDLNGEFFEVTQAQSGTRLLKIEPLNDYEKLQSYYQSNTAAK